MRRRAFADRLCILAFCRRGADLEFMKAKIQAGEEPWKSAWDLWLDSPVASLDFKPKPFVHVIRGAYDAGEQGRRASSRKARTRQKTT